MIDLKMGKRSARLVLSGELGYDQLQPLLQTAQQMEAVGKPLTLDWRDLHTLHYACLQVLMALVKSMTEKGCPVQLSEPSPELHAILLRYGIWAGLGSLSLHT